MSLTIRDATPDDYPIFTRFFAQLGVPDDDPVPTPEQWSAWCPNAMLAMRDGLEVGYAVTMIYDGVGYVFHIVVDGAHRGGGIGLALMNAIAARFRERGLGQWCLNVRRDNAAAIRLYERCGMRVAYESDAMRIAWADVARLPLEADPPEVRPLATEEDEGIERAFDMPRGRLANVRKAGRVLLVARARDARIAFGAFDPAFPGAFPFHTQRATLARALFEAMRPHALPAHDYVRVVVENDAALAETLRAAGARTLVPMFHMRGSLPNAAS